MCEKDVLVPILTLNVSQLCTPTLTALLVHHFDGPVEKMFDHDADDVEETVQTAGSEDDNQDVEAPVRHIANSVI